MKFIHLFKLSLVIFFGLAIVSCSKEQITINGELPSHKETTITQKSSSNIVRTKQDFIVLHQANIYPFSTLSPAQLQAYLSKVVFTPDGNYFRGDAYGLDQHLTKNQFMLWFQKAFRRNVSIDDSGATISFQPDLPGEPQYSPLNNPLGPEILLERGYDPWYPADKFSDCVRGDGLCTIVNLDM